MTYLLRSTQCRLRDAKIAHERFLWVFEFSSNWASEFFFFLPTFHWKKEHLFLNFSDFLVEFHPFLIQNTWKIQSILDTQRWKKYIIVTVYSTIYCRAWDLWTFQSEFDHHRKKNIFASSYSTNMVHGAMEKFNRYLTSSEKEIFSFLAKARKCSTKVLATIVHVTWKNSIGYRPQRKQIFLYLASQIFVAVYRGYNGPPYSYKPRWCIDWLVHSFNVCLGKSRYGPI